MVVCYLCKIFFYSSNYQHEKTEEINSDEPYYQTTIEKNFEFFQELIDILIDRESPDEKFISF